jgi:hypothetical protein
MTGYLVGIAEFAAGTLEQDASLPPALALRPRNFFEEAGPDGAFEATEIDAAPLAVSGENQSDVKQAEPQNQESFTKLEPAQNQQSIIEPAQAQSEVTLTAAITESDSQQAATKSMQRQRLETKKAETETAAAPSALPSEIAMLPEQVADASKDFSEAHAQPSSAPKSLQPEYGADADKLQTSDTEAAPNLPSSKYKIISATQDPQDAIEDVIPMPEATPESAASEGVNVSIGRIEVIVQPPVDAMRPPEPIPMPMPAVGPKGPNGTAGFDGYAARRRGVLR